MVENRRQRFESDTCTSEDSGYSENCIFGCSDEQAVNYDPLVTIDNGSCILDACIPDNYRESCSVDDLTDTGGFLDLKLDPEVMRNMGISDTVIARSTGSQRRRIAQGSEKYECNKFWTFIDGQDITMMHPNLQPDHPLSRSISSKIMDNRAIPVRCKFDDNQQCSMPAEMNDFS